MHLYNGEWPFLLPKAEKKFDYIMKEKNMKKEKHPVYRWLMAFLLMLLLAGIILLIAGIQKGSGPFFLPGYQSV